MTTNSEATNDGFVNILKGLGTAKDARQNNTYIKGIPISMQVADDLYAYNGLASSVVDIPVDDAISKWRRLLIDDAEERKDVEERMKKFGVQDKLSLAMKWARVFGGAGIIIILKTQDLEEPLDLERISPGSLSNLIVLDRYNLNNESPNRNVLSENFGEPEYYTVVRGGQKIHRSRVIRFDGVISSIAEFERNNYWGSSIFTRLYDPISDSQTVSNSISTSVYEANIDVYRINGLNKLVAEQKDNLVVKRLQIMHEMKSLVNGSVIDKEDEFEKKGNKFTDLPEIDDRFMQKVSGISKIPVTKLAGISPAGQNATGESDMNNYYDGVRVVQTNEVGPKLDLLDNVIAQSEGIKPFEYVWNPLKVPTEAEQATIDNTNADRDGKYLNQGVIKDSDVLAELVENGTYGSIDEARVAELKKMEDEEEELGFGEEEEEEEPENTDIDTNEGSKGSREEV